MTDIYVKSFGAKGDGVTDDTAAIYAALAAVVPDRGYPLVFDPGIYLVPNGITETKPGLVVVGLGARSTGPGGQGTRCGAVLKATAPGAWTWRRTGAVATQNEYRGARFSNIVFAGNNVTAGGLCLQTNFNITECCGSCGHTTGVGVKTLVGPAPLDDASWNVINYWLSSDDWIGAELGDANGRGAASAQINGFINIKYSAGGISGKGTGIRVWDNNSSIFGGKLEDNDVGVEIKSTPGIMVSGTRFEGSVTRDIKLYRMSGTNGTRNMIVCPTSSIHVGPFQVNDMIIGGDWQGKYLDEGKGTVRWSA